YRAGRLQVPALDRPRRRPAARRQREALQAPAPRHVLARSRVASRLTPAGRSIPLMSKYTPMPRFERLVGQAIAVHDLERAIESFERIGLPSPGEPIATDGTVAVRMALNDGGYIELISVADADAPGGAALAEFLAAGEGLYRTDLSVSDLPGLHPELSDDGGAARHLGPLVQDSDGVRSALVFAEPAAVGWARFDLVDAGCSVAVERRTWCDRIYTHAVAVAAIDPAVGA